MTGGRRGGGVAARAALAIALLLALAGEAAAQAMGEYGRLLPGAPPRTETRTPRPASAGGPQVKRAPGGGSGAARTGVRRLPAGLAALPDSAYEMALVRTLADPSYEGRGVGTAGLDSAEALLAGQMRSLGLRPGGADGGYAQPFQVTTGVQVGEPCSIELHHLRWHRGETFQPLGFSTNGTLAAQVVFAGYGITAPGYDYDDYAGLEVRDRIVLVLAQEPGEMDSTSRFDGSVNTPHAELRTKAINAREHGALAMLVVNGPRYHAGEPLRTPRADGEGYMTSGLLAAAIGEGLADSLLRHTVTFAARGAAELDHARVPKVILKCDRGRCASHRGTCGRSA